MRIRRSHSAIPWQARCCAGGHSSHRDRQLTSAISGQLASFSEMTVIGSGQAMFELRVIPTESLLTPRLVGSADLVHGLGVIGEGLKAVRNVGWQD